MATQVTFLSIMKVVVILKKQSNSMVYRICKSESTKIFHNAMYDVCWIRSMGIQINGQIVDTMIAASL